MKSACLLTGRPGTGKTTLIKQLIAEARVSAGGFYTEEIRQNDVRQGFRLVTLTGESVTLAHISIKSLYRVGKYGVDVAALERVGVPALYQASQQCGLVVIDEIGRMELFSGQFRQAVLEIITGGKHVLGTIMFNSDTYASEIKHLAQVDLITLTRNNHDEVRGMLQQWLAGITPVATRKD